MSGPEHCAVVGTPAAASYVLNLLTELGVPHRRYDDLGAAPLDECGSVLVLAAEYPATGALMDADADSLLVYLRSGGRAYVEYTTGPAELLPVAAGPVRVAGTDRIYVAEGNEVLRGLAPLSILDEHSSSMLPVTPPGGAVELLSYGRVAGTHTAVFGPAEESWPALLDLGVGNGRLLYATTALSNAERGRYRPAARWRALLRELLTTLHPGPVAPPAVELITVPRVWAASGAPVRLRAVCAAGAPPPTVGPSGLPLTEVGPGVYESEPVELPDGVHTFTADGSSASVEIGPREQRYRRMVERGIGWFHRAGMFFDSPDGSAGVAEGFASEIGPDGVSPFGPVRRGDGHVQVSHAFRMYADLTGDQTQHTIADNVMDLVTDRMQLTDRNALYGAFEPRDARTDLTGTNNLFADDNGWISMFALLSGAVLPGLRGVESLIRSANAELGLQPDPWRTPTTLLTRGWSGAAEAPLNEGLDVSSHWQSSALCAYLTAYGLTGERRYLEVAERGLDHMAKQFPRTRLETSRTCEAVRFVLPLVGGYRYTRKPLYLDTLRAIAAYLKTKQDPDSGGLLEWDGRNPRSNAGFGVDEASIFQSNGDPVTDQLYCTGFAAMSLPLAARETGDELYDELATGVLDFLARIQLDIGDERLDGTWMRAFDVHGWEYFGSNADIGWGPYCVETGWSHAPSLIGAMLWLTDADLYPPAGQHPVTDGTALAARVAAEFDSIAAGRPEPARFFRRDPDGRVAREQGGATAVLGDLRAAGEPVWVDNPPAASVEIYVRGEDGRLHHNYLHERTGQGGWRQVGDLEIAGEPAVVFNPAADAVEVYVRGADGRIHHTTMVDARAGHGPWDPVGHLAFDTDPAVVFDTERNKVLVSARDRETVKENRWHPPWQDPFAPVTRWETA